jgi:hypothetical protein
MLSGVKFAAGLFSLLSVIICSRATAQSSYYIEKPHMTFNGGLIAGGNFTQVDGDTYSGYNKAGLNAGGVVYIHFTQYIGISMELLYSQKGSRGITDAQSVNVGEYIEAYHMTLNYAEVPLLFHGITTIFGRKGDLEGGISYGRLIKSSEWIGAEPPVVVNPVLNRFNNTDFNYIIGLSVKLYKHWYVNGRFQYSIVDIRPTDRVPFGYSYSDKGQFNNLCVLRLIYYF